MALTKSIIKLNEGEAVVKVAGDSGSVTIDLQTDLLSPTHILEATQNVTIVGVGWTGAGDNIFVERNSIRVLTLPSSNPDYIDFSGQDLPPDNTASTFDIVVSKSGTGNVELYLKLRKVSGYRSNLEPAAFGPYDNPILVGV